MKPALIEPADGISCSRRADVGPQSTPCAICHRSPAVYTCDSCERDVCESCLVRSPLFPLSCFCSEECISDADLAAEHARDSDPYAQHR